ncbi:hypothetical protein [Cellulomonas sp. URHB0016]
MSTMSGPDADGGRDEALARPTPSSVRLPAATVNGPEPVPAVAGSGGPERVPAVAGSGGPTGDPHVDAALTRLDGLEDVPLREHVAHFDAVHRALGDRLADAEGVGA